MILSDNYCSLMIVKLITILIVLLEGSGLSLRGPGRARHLPDLKEFPEQPGARWEYMGMGFKLMRAQKGTGT